MGFTSLTSRFVLFSFNFGFVLLGLAAIIYGALVLKNSKDAGEGIIDIHNGAPLAALITGTFVMVLSSLGCWGALRESRGILLTYSFVVFFLMIIESVIGGYLIARHHQIRGLTENAIKYAIKEATEFNMTRFQSDLDDLQLKLKCCGGSGPMDWQEIRNFNSSLPSSCCGKRKPDVVDCSVEAAYYVGCAEAFEKKIAPFFNMLITVTIIIAVLQVFGVVGSCCVIGKTNKRSEYIIS